MHGLSLLLRHTLLPLTVGWGNMRNMKGRYPDDLCTPYHNLTSNTIRLSVTGVT